MKPRKLAIKVEVMTALPFQTLKALTWWPFDWPMGKDPDAEIIRVQISVIKKDQG